MLTALQSDRKSDDITTFCPPLQTPTSRYRGNMTDVLLVCVWWGVIIKMQLPTWTRPPLLPDTPPLLPLLQTGQPISSRGGGRA